MENLTPAEMDSPENTALSIDKKLRTLLESKTKNNLLASLYLADIQRNSIYKKLECNSMKDYISILSNKTGAKSSRIQGWLNIGKIYLRYEKDLKEIGFGEKHGPSKLRFLKKALETHEKEEVYRNLITLSYDNFLNYVNGVNKTFLDKQDNREGKTPKNTEVFFNLNGKKAITINQEIDKEIFTYLVRINKYAIKAIKKGEKILYLSVKNTEEYNLFESSIKRLIRKLRRNIIANSTSPTNKNLRA